MRELHVTAPLQLYLLLYLLHLLYLLYYLRQERGAELRRAPRDRAVSTVLLLYHCFSSFTTT